MSMGKFLWQRCSFIQEIPPITDFQSFIMSFRTGAIEVNELAVAMRAMGFEPRKEEVRRILTQLDKDLDGFIDYDEFKDVS